MARFPGDWHCLGPSGDGVSGGLKCQGWNSHIQDRTRLSHPPGPTGRTRCWRPLSRHPPRILRSPCGHRDTETVQCTARPQEKRNTRENDASPDRCFHGGTGKVPRKHRSRNCDPGGPRHSARRGSPGWAEAGSGWDPTQPKSPRANCAATFININQIIPFHFWFTLLRTHSVRKCDVEITTPLNSPSTGD